MTFRAILLCIFLLKGLLVSAEVSPFYKLHETYGEVIGEPVKSTTGNSVFLTYRKEVNGKARYSLLEFDGVEVRSIENFPKCPNPTGAEEEAQKRGMQMPPQADLYYTGFCANYKGKLLVGLTRFEGDDSGYFIYEYRNGTFHKFLFSDTWMQSIQRLKKAEQMGIDLNDPNSIVANQSVFDSLMNDFHFNTFGKILFQSTDALVFEAEVDKKSGYYSYDGSTFTFLYDLPATTTANGKIMEQGDFVYTVQCGNKLFSLVQRTVPGSRKIASRDLFAYDLQTKQHIKVTHNELLNGAPTQFTPIEFSQSSGRELDLLKAKGELTSIGDIVFYSGLLKNQSSQNGQFQDGERRGLFFYQNGTFTRLPIQNTTDHLLGCLSLMKGYMIFSARTAVDPLLDARLMKASGNSPFPQGCDSPMKLQGYRFSLITHSFPIGVEDKQVFHFKDHLGFDTHFAFDGEKFELYTGFQISKETAHENEFPTNVFSLGGKTFMFLKAKKVNDDNSNYHFENVLTEWKHAEDDFPGGFYR